MFFTKQQTLDEYIVRKLSIEPPQAFNELINSISPVLNKKITPQAWYKAVKRLTRQGVIIKQKKYYSLNISWAVDALRWSYALKNNYIEKVHEKVIKLPRTDGQKIKYSFPDLLSMNAFWAHTLVYIAAQNPKNNTGYAYNPHFWFYLANDPVERQYNRGMEELGSETFMIIGSNSFLDQWNAQFFPKTVTFWLSPQPLYPNFAIHINYISGYLIEVKLKKAIADRIHKIFTTTQTISGISQLELIALFQQKSLCAMTISKNRAKGEAFKRKIMRHF